jgi:hypothetical protein
MATMLTICMVATASQVMNTTLFLAVVLETILQNDPGIL